METKTLITIYGMRRSGNHCLANWIMSHFKSGCYINDSCHIPKRVSSTLPCHDSGLCSKINIENSPDLIIIGVERFIDIKINQNYSDLVQNIYPKHKIKNIQISLIRHFPNLVASHLKAWGGDYHEKLADQWKNHVKFYSNCNNINNFYSVVYDHWLDEEYKNILSKNIGFDNKNLGIDAIPKYGGGSSFKDKIPIKEKLKNRWKTMLSNNRFLNILYNFKYWEDHINIFGKDSCYYHFNKAI